jgi:ABC-type Fe3+-hydroxamate transport system substrate-binding protein
MRILVCGGRTFADAAFVDEVLSIALEDHPDLVIGAGYDPNDPKFQGADQLAVEWAKAHGVPGFCYPAFWKQDGRSAGPRRNQRQLEKFKPDIVVALPGGDGTADMVERATRAGVATVVYQYAKPPRGA